MFLNDDINNEAIESEEFDVEIEEEQKDIPKNRKLSMDNADRTIKDVLNEVKDEKIIIDPDFQRNYVWNKVQSSKLIESILINIPIPNIYLSETKNGKWEVIDGVQRLTSLLKFRDNDYALKGLEVMSELNGKKYGELDEEVKDYLDDKIIRYVRIKKESSADIKFDVFMRLNQGSVKLNEQELRNCLYRGDLNNELKTIADKNEKYKKLLNVKQTSNIKIRMKTIELLLRFLAFDTIIDLNDIDNFAYSGRIKLELNNFMENNMSEVKYNDKINDAINKCYDVFYNDKISTAFRLSGQNKINLALAEAQLIICYNYKDVPNEVIFETFNKLLNNDIFDDKLRNATGNSNTIKVKYQMIIEEINARA